MSRIQSQHARSWYWRFIATVLLIGACFFTSGCWDRQEIQDRGFVLAVAIDLAENEEGKAIPRLEQYVQPHGQPRYRISIQVLKLAEAKGGSEKPGGEASKTYTLTNTGISLFDTFRDMLGRSSKAMWFENLQVIIISEDVVKKYGLSPVMDFWQRDAEMRWRAVVYITPGKAEKLLEYQPPTGEAGGIYMAELARRQVKNPHLATVRSTLSFVSQGLAAGADIGLPCLEQEGKTVKIKGAAIFRKEKFIGYIDEYTIKGMRFIRGTEKGAVITFECPTHPGNLVAFELFRHNTIVKPRVEGDNISFNIDIAMRGNLDEVQCQGKHDTTSPEYLKKAQQLIAEEVKKNIAHSLAVSQSTGVDLLYFKESLKAYEPKIWDKIKDRWDEVYPTLPVNVSVNAAIIDVGEHE
jgi:spore germination protein KC